MRPCPRPPREAALFLADRKPFVGSWNRHRSFWAWPCRPSSSGQTATFGLRFAVHGNLMSLRRTRRRHRMPRPTRTPTAAAPRSSPRICAVSPCRIRSYGKAFRRCNLKKLAAFTCKVGREACYRRALLNLIVFRAAVLLNLPVRLQFEGSLCGPRFRVLFWLVDGVLVHHSILLHAPQVLD